MTSKPNDWMVSPTIRMSDVSSPPTLDEQIKVFESQVLGWQLNIAKEVVAEIQHSGFATLSIVLSYFEAIGKAKLGVNKDDRQQTGDRFRHGFRDFLAGEQANEETEDMMTEFYAKVRCGLYHAGMTKNFVFLTGDGPSTITYDPTTKTLAVNPHFLVPKMIDHFKAFIATLRDTSNTAERQNFATFFA